jgi:hypothetical protein
VRLYASLKISFLHTRAHIKPRLKMRRASVYSSSHVPVIGAEALELAKQSKTSPAPTPKPKAETPEEAAKAKEKALSRWEGEGGALVPSKKKKGSRKK